MTVPEEGIWAPKQDRHGGLKENLFFPEILRVPTFLASEERGSGQELWLCAGLSCSSHKI